MKKKTIALLLVLMMIFGVTCGGTIAYLTSKTDTVVNTFTVGNVTIKLDEAKVGTDGKATNDRIAGVPEGATFSNTYKLIPGGVYDKDPTVYVKKGSEQSYIRMMVTVTYADDADANDDTNITADDVLAKYKYISWFDFDKAWVPQEAVKTVKADGKITRTYEFRYKDAYTAPAADDSGEEYVALEDLFQTVKIPGEITNDELATLSDLSISVEAHAIQAAGFGTADLAWAAWN